MKKILLKDQSGASLIEFAFIAPILFLLLMGIVEMGLFFYAQNVIENATSASARYGITGSAYEDEYICPKKNSRSEFIRCAVDRYSNGLLDPANVTIQTQIFDGGFEDVNDDNYNFDDDKPKPPNYGDANQAVVYHVTYKWKFFTPLIGHFFSKNNEYTIQSNVLVKNENFR